MKYWAIKHKPTGYLMPEYSSRRGRGGFTSDEPSDPKDIPPRLFLRESDAKRALAFWLQGRTSVCRSSYDGDEDWHTEKVPGRKKELMEVVEVEICLK